MNGTLASGDHVKFFATQKDYHADEIGVLKLKQFPRQSMSAGDVGYIISGIKSSREVKVGDTITHVVNPSKTAIEGFENSKTHGFCRYLSRGC